MTDYIVLILFGVAVTAMCAIFIRMVKGYEFKEHDEHEDEAI